MLLTYGSSTFFRKLSAGDSSLPLDNRRGCGGTENRKRSLHVLLRQRGHGLTRELCKVLHIRMHAIISLLTPVLRPGICLPPVRVRRVQGAICEVHADPLEVLDHHRFGANALLVANIPPEALVHQERTGDTAWLLPTQGLHRSAQATMHNEAVHLLEESSKVSPFNLTELAPCFESICPRDEVTRHDCVPLQSANVDQTQTMGTLLHHSHTALYHQVPCHWHAAEGHEPEACTCRSCRCHEASQGLCERAVPRTPAEEDEVRELHATPPI
mmetsp:Transcript_6432/g.15246  ORF Transcript_6432/g.15246 Transcript_6432/m.15246 type:complete len:271 (+) Transcript_6432:450-1262(+)